jgi:hypothetical protein
VLDGKPYRSRQYAQLRGHQPSVLVEQSAFQRGVGALGATDDGEVEEPPSKRTAAYVAALLERWCDITEDEEETSSWSSGPLSGNAKEARRVPAGYEAGVTVPDLAAECSYSVGTVDRILHQAGTRVRPKHNDGPALTPKKRS